MHVSSARPEVLTLTDGNSTAIVHPGCGGRLGQVDLGDGPLLRGPRPDLSWIEWGCYPLAPWSNRIPGGRLQLGDLDAILPTNHDDGSAIHGLVAACRWQVGRLDVREAELWVDVRCGPYEVAARQHIRLSDGALDLRLAVRNIGGSAMPMGIGIHPWFRAGPVRVPAERVWPGEPLPTGPPERVHGPHDLRSGSIPDAMDACFTALTGSSADVPGAMLAWNGPVDHVVVYSAQPGWVCVEPVTMANDGIGLAHRGVARHGVAIVGPGDDLEASFRSSDDQS